MTEANVVTCVHPTCQKKMKRSQSACGLHWHSLPAELQRQLTDGRRKGPSAFGAAKIDARAYLQSKMIGPWDFRECRGANCHVELVWLPRGDMRVPVPAVKVLASDRCFDPRRHTDHRDDCNSMAELRKDRSL